MQNADLKKQDTADNTADKKPRIVIMAGGTGGHVFPALAIAAECLKQGFEVLWLGTREGMEASLVPEANIPIRFIAVKKIRRHGFLRKLLAPFYIVWAILQSLGIFHQFKPQVVLSMGGYVAGPGGIAAWLLRIPIVVHEQNAIAGLTNQILARLSVKVLEGFPNSFPSKLKAIWVGNPVRSELVLLPSLETRFVADPPLKVLILGGSQGAQAINQLLPEVMAKIPGGERPEIWHQTGKQHLQETKDKYKYQAQGSHPKVEAFIHNMTEAYTWADLVICRAGASTVSELACIGIPSLLIPFPFAVDDHQTHNGRFLERAGGAQILPQNLLDSTKLADIILSFSRNKRVLLNMAIAARSVAKPQATQTVVSVCCESMK